VARTVVELDDVKAPMPIVDTFMRSESPCRLLL